MTWLANNDMWRHLLFLCETMPHSYLNILEKTVNLFCCKCLKNIYLFIDIFYICYFNKI